MKQRLINISFILFLILTQSYAFQKSNTPPQNVNKPNILLIVADDMGYADLGCFGSDILTPNIDALAAEGVRFSNFYSAPSCAPTRAALITGTDNHVAGVGSQFHRNDEQWGYEGRLSKRVVTIPQVLKTVNYQTYMVGKWHLGSREEDLAERKGFDKSFIMYQGAGNHHNNVGFEAPDRPSTYALNGEVVDWPKDEYSTDLYTDYLINFIKEGDNDKPFFAFAAYTSPHWPLQVAPEYWKKYEANYVEGYEVLRKRRLNALKAKGLIDENHPLPPLHPDVKAWDSLSPKEQKIEIRKMALYAGMLENLDANIGRLIQQLKDNGTYNNTLIVFMSDNGAAYRDFYESGPFAEFLQANYDNSYENMGAPDSFVSYGPQWAEAGSAPFRYFKQYMYEGGVRTPLIIRHPNVKNKGSINKEKITLTDLAPTFYEVATADYPETYNGNTIYPLKGKSALDMLSSDTKQIHSNTDTYIMEHHHHVLVRQGNWKLVNPGEAWNDSKFELYNIVNDPSESIDVKTEHLDIYNALLKIWLAYKKENKIVRY
ncbi:arylsulfatase [Winogradskyella sp. A3E31]|uniref:arylsulfatase n=1 Tax=Winogradskyella sp. A3E31 TaxID=3349637 RepID=UPI00398B1632